MKTSHFLRYTLVMALLMSVPGVASAVTSATSLTTTVYKVLFSTSGLCTAPFETIDFGSSGKALDVLAASPEFGSGKIANGTYKCIVFKMSDTVRFTPTATDGACTGGTAVTLDVCQPFTSSGTTITPTTKNPETGASSNCSTSNDTVFVYVSRFSTTTEGSSTHNGLLPPSADGDATQGFKLSADVTIDGDKTGTFVFDARNKVDGTTNQGTCTMNPPNFGFRL